MQVKNSSLNTARSLLLDPWGITSTHLAETLNTVMTHAVDYADIYFQYTRSEGWSLEEGLVKTGSFSIDQGVGVRAVSGEKTAFAYSDVLSTQSLMNAAKAVQTIARVGEGQVKVKELSPVDSLRQLYAPIDPLASRTADEKVRLLERIELLAKAKDPRVVQVMASLGMEYDVVLVLNHLGRLAADVRPLVRLSVNVVVEQNGRKETGHAGGGGRTDLHYFTDAVINSYVEQAVHEACVNLEARPAPAGEMTVVLGSGWPGILLHEAVGHGFEADFNRKGSSIFSDRIGERVASPGVTVVDDGTIAERRGSLNMDDEGNPTQRTVLIEDGIMRSYLQDSLNARLMGLELTGNGRRESYAHLPMPRMTNTFMMAGQYDPEEIIRSVKNGIYAVNFGGGQVDITSGKFVFSTSEAYKIENGKVTYPIKGATLIGSGPESMQKISMLGNDLRLDTGVGTCGKDGQSVPVGVGQPTLKMDGLTVGGTAV